MSDAIKQHLPVIVVVFLLGIAATVFALSRVYASAGSFDVDGFSLAVFIIPCIAMVICSFIIMLTAHTISRQLFLIVSAICFVTGIVGMVITSGWFSHPEIATALLANSADGTTITPPINNMLVVIRNIAAYVVAPTVGSILGAWIGSRLHPMNRA